MQTNTARRDNHAVRKYEVLKLRRQGLTIKTISEKLGISHSTVHRNIKSCLKDCIKHGEKDVKYFRELELNRLDGMLNVLKEKVSEGDVKAVSVSLKIAKRRAELLGLDAPVKTEIFDNITFILPDIEKKESI